MNHLEQKLYFEKQNIFSTNCAIHAVNNVIGCQAFSTKTFNQICQLLQKQAKKNGYQTKNKHLIAGDYDANVIIKALQNCGLQISWIDSRIDYKYKYIQGTVPNGYIVNMQSSGENLLNRIFSLSGRHWVCIKLLRGQYYLLDSKEQDALKIQDIDYFINRIRNSNCQILQIRSRINQTQPIINNKIKQSLVQNGIINLNKNILNTNLSCKQEQNKSLSQNQKQKQKQKQRQKQKQDCSQKQKQKQNYIQKQKQMQKQMQSYNKQKTQQQNKKQYLQQLQNKKLLSIYQIQLSKLHQISTINNQ